MHRDTTWLVANWKMNGSLPIVRAYAHALNAALGSAPAAVNCVFCPPFPYLISAAEALPQNARLKLGAQNCHSEPKGAFTGEISAAMLADVGCRYVILGHSERRLMGETDAMIIHKAKAAITANLIPILCIGESLEAHQAKKTLETLTAQLAPIATLGASPYVMAYEPIWAIGSGNTPTLAEIASAHAQIKSVLGSQTSVLYGGSVNAGNAKEILKLPEVSGALIGGASLQIASMVEIISAA